MEFNYKNLNYKLFFKLTKTNKNQLLNIINDTENLKFMGTKWTSEKIEDLIKYSKIDYKNNYKNTEYLYICILYNKKVIGIVYSHPSIYLKNKYIQLGVFIDKQYQNMGITKYALNYHYNIFKKYFKKKLIGIVNINNTSSIRFYNKHFKIIEKNFTFKNNKYNIYLQEYINI